MITNITKENFEAEVLKADTPVLVDFWASWCGPCKMIAPEVEKVAMERNDIKVCKINVDEEGELAQRFKVRTIPTLMVMRDGEMVKRSSGAMPKHKILEMVQ